LIIKVLIQRQKTNSTKKLKLLNEILRYDSYYSLTFPSSSFWYWNEAKFMLNLWNVGIYNEMLEYTMKGNSGNTGSLIQQV
jgi:hypothetical protein